MSHGMRLALLLVSVGVVVLGASAVAAETPTPAPVTPTVAVASPTSSPRSATATSTRGPASAPLVVKVPVTALDAEKRDVDPALNSATKIYQRISAVVGGVVCDSADLVKDRKSGFVTLQVGLPGQPAPCRQEGAEVGFAFGPHAEFPLRAVLNLEHGVTRELTSLKIYPPATGDEAALPLAGVLDEQVQPRGDARRSTFLALAVGVVIGTLLFLNASRRA